MKEKIIIIGAGASGLFAAIKASERDCEITVLEANDKPGKKILMTGNGRCNITNKILSADYYYSEDTGFVKGIINRFNSEDTIKEFAKFGVVTRDKNNYIYPNSMQAGTILSALLSVCNLRGVKILTNSIVKKINNDEGLFTVTAYNSKENKEMKYEASKILLACGTNASLKEDNLSGINKFILDTGHKFYNYEPALCSIFVKKSNNKILNSFFKNSSGVRTEIKCKLYFNNDYIAKSDGELQITDYGFSGIVIFQISRFISRINKDFPKTKKTLYIDFIPSLSTVDIINIFKSQMYYEKKSLQDLFNGLVNAKLSHELLILYSSMIDNNVKPFNKNLSDEKLKEIIEFFKNTPFIIDKTNDVFFSQVCTGGVNTNDITEKMQSRLVNNLYFSGECIDVDGMCGGYNLQWAWATGYIAGRSMTDD